MNRATLSLAAWTLVGALQVVLGAVEAAAGGDATLLTAVRILVGLALVVSFGRSFAGDADPPAVADRRSFAFVGVVLAALWLAVLVRAVVA